MKKSIKVLKEDTGIGEEIHFLQMIYMYILSCWAFAENSS